MEKVVKWNQLKKRRKKLEIEENEPGISCIAALIFDNRGQITAAVCVSGPSFRMTDKKFDRLQPLITEIGN
ncbi:IclR family transcriptional regulator C-terminal domain-containing protein [Metabacillus herbersteinensis]|uniref:IclR family transcriptional regulator C-terminal domain-containing protein n=1 Tax=Metabacillus herbersteinensis TaxID=283816 RepID=A0ABV6GML4_9BACI